MQRFRSILVVVSGKDGGQAALAEATLLATENSATIRMVDAIPSLPDYLDLPGSEPARLHKAEQTKKLAHMEQLSAAPRAAGIDVTYELMRGDLAEKTVDRVIKNGHDLVLKSAEQPSGMSQRLFGTAGHRLFRKCPCPVWIIKSDSYKQRQHLLVAVDPLPLEQKRSPLNIKIMELGASLATQSQCALHAVYVWPPWARKKGSELNRDRDGIPGKAGYVADTLQAAMLDRLIEPYKASVSKLHTHLLTGQPGDCIVELAGQLDADLLIMGTISRSQPRLFSIGSTAEFVLNNVNCSVLAVK